MSISLDAENAFNKVLHLFITKSLKKKKRIEGACLNTIKAINNIVLSWNHERYKDIKMSVHSTSVQYST